ncbi:hypothetical protein [Streptomyces fuscichromogenes]|uniref:Uncharacterized protein n=1 Tax=Streptomyces fuscichromogenes TaxID=1324013 RepID=A0A917X9J9_9ACTN|nr:hypothetical protein [Streptomyces fuscichromogenes]GGM97557.1 hypothetical protein GCM10011578_017950 [Streptomyces fuscichromogenes]
MKTPGARKTPHPADDETRRRSAEQRNVTAPTPRDVRDKAKAKDAPESPTGESS